MANKAQKPGDLLVNQRGGRRREMTVLSNRRESPPPPPPADLQQASVAIWNGIWQSRVAVRWDEESDLPQIEHLIWCIDERDRSRRAFRRKRLAEGSTGQVVLNPLAGWIGKLDRTIAQIAEKLGITPLDRMRLGITFFEGKSRAQELMESFEEPDGSDIIDLDEP